jgi:hypothetical protein
MKLIKSMLRKYLPHIEEPLTGQGISFDTREGPNKYTWIS